MLHGQPCTKTAHGLIVSYVQCWVSAFIFTLLGNWDKSYIAAVSSVIHSRLLSKQYGYKIIPYGSGGKGATEEDKTHFLPITSVDHRAHTLYSQLLHTAATDCLYGAWVDAYTLTMLINGRLVTVTVLMLNRSPHSAFSLYKPPWC